MEHVQYAVVEKRESFERMNNKYHGLLEVEMQFERYLDLERKFLDQDREEKAEREERDRKERQLKRMKEAEARAKTNDDDDLKRFEEIEKDIMKFRKACKNINNDQDLMEYLIHIK
jgi:hypothetical protein